MTFKHIIAAAFLAAAVVFAPLAVVAQEEEGPQVLPVLNMQISGFEVQVPAPDWGQGDSQEDALDKLQISVTEPGNGVAVMTINKADENAILWSELMGVVAINNPGYTAGLAFETMAKPMGQRCRTEALELFWIKPLPDTEHEALVALCGQYRPQARQDRPCIAGIVVMVAKQKPEGVVSVYHEWCTDSFDADNDGAWAVSRDALETRARQLQALTEFAPAGAGEDNSAE